MSAELQEIWVALPDAEKRDCFELDFSDERTGIIEHYLQCRLEGTGHKLALMFASQQSPSIQGTDSTFWAGIGMGSQFAKADQDMGNFYREKAKKAGVSVKGKHYLGQLAAYPGDPKAWVSDRHDVQKVAEERGWKVSGSVNTSPSIYKEDTAPVANPPKPFKPYTLADAKAKGKKALGKPETRSLRH